MHIQEIINIIEQTASLKGAAPWDKSGVQIAGSRDEISTIAVMLDPSPHNVAKAVERKADLLLAHHPVLMEPAFLDTPGDFHAVAKAVLGAGAWVYSAHTSLDVNPNGPAGWLARALDFSVLDILEQTHCAEAIGVLFEIEDEDTALLTELEVLDAVLDVSRDENGEVLLACMDEDWPALKPFIAETLGYSPVFLRAELALPQRRLGFGFIGELPAPLDFPAFSKLLEQHVARDFWTLIGPEPESVSRVAYCTGSGAALAPAAFASGAQVYITGDMKYHDALAAPGCIVDVGHFTLEEEMMRRFADQLRDDPALADIEIVHLAGKDPQRVRLARGDNES